MVGFRWRKTVIGFKQGIRAMAIKWRTTVVGKGATTLAAHASRNLTACA